MLFFLKHIDLLFMLEVVPLLIITAGNWNILLTFLFTFASLATIYMDIMDAIASGQLLSAQPNCFH